MPARIPLQTIPPDKIVLADGAVVTVDPDALQCLLQAKVSIRRKRGYRPTVYLKDHSIPLARLVMGLGPFWSVPRWDDRRVVKHLNGDTLDCRRANLEVVTETADAMGPQMRRAARERIGWRGW